MDALTDKLLAAIQRMPVVTTGRLPELVEAAWPDCVLIGLRAWATGLGRDLRRAIAALAAARPAAATAPDDDQIASLEECFWRISAAVEKFDALVGLAFDGRPLRPQRENPTRLELRPSVERNKSQLRELASETTRRLIERRSRIGRSRAELRRNQVMHSLAPLASLDDLSCFIRVTHRDGRIMVGGYELVRFVPDRWDEGTRELAPEVLSARRLLEAERALDDLQAAVRALIDALESDGALREPQWIYREYDTRAYTWERPASQGRPRSYEVDFVFRREDAEDETRRISCESMPSPGTEIGFDDGVWRVIEVNLSDQTGVEAQAILIPKR
jgi:hypothetical protein